ncbi:hypothetical protein PR202_gb04716 [Eleusine coracana subsp. coracana]|uniref:Uncharacterized protein n=1 Tax=Eleusine coracana subsp. coracana TaxID=191504 RepID=A0AAV5E583_ELECO|nr:hypothetical protein PR202_gb04716 [Eleusine coracana subsp. coracana]
MRHLLCIALLLSAVLPSETARDLRQRTEATPIPAGRSGSATAEMTVPDAGQSAGGAAARESKRLSPGGPDPQHH